MVCLVNTTREPDYFGITYSKEELLAKVSQMFDVCATSGCTRFDLTINTDVDYKEL